VDTQALPSELLDRVEQLSAAVDELPDAKARELAQALVSAIIAMYGDGLERIMATIAHAEDAPAILDELAADGAVASLLLIHDLYPVPLEERVREALDTVRPYMESHGGNVELVSLNDGIARLVLEGSCNGCTASRATLELAIKQALEEHAPDLAGLEVEGVTDPFPAAGNGFELPLVHAGADPAPISIEPPPSGWVALPAGKSVADGELKAVVASGVEIVLARVSGGLLAYRDRCASCGEPLHAGALDGPMLRCASCAVEFDLPRAGRAAGGEPLQLTPVPLLESGGVRVAL
jgi:Fe-S cluster biogenesis protein NfuA/nitrite reductase/ring-hydroxylating ferredoxin subunit